MNRSDTGLSDRLEDLAAQVAALSDQVGVLGAQTDYLAERARRDERRQQEWDELKADATPVVNDLYLATVEQLGQIEPHVQLDDMLRLVKRLARNTRNIEAALDQLESLRDFLDDAGPLTHDVLEQAVLGLEDLERRGYSGFARASVEVMDHVVESFTADDVGQLGDNIVLILETVKAMTQPEIMNLVNRVTVAYRDVERSPDELSTSTFGLLNQMRDPDVRRGLAITMLLLKTVARQTDRGAGSQNAPETK